MTIRLHSWLCNNPEPTSELSVRAVPLWFPFIQNLQHSKPDKLGYHHS